MIGALALSLSSDDSCICNPITMISALALSLSSDDSCSCTLTTMISALSLSVQMTAVSALLPQ